MNAKLIDGKAVSAELRGQMKAEVAALAEEGITPGLAVVLVGEDPASQVYVRNKEKACEELGIYSEKYLLPAQTTQEELLALVDKLNGKPDIDGILVQLPLPGHLDEKAVIAAISPEKDVDAFHAQNVGKIMIGNYKFLPCTPAGVMELLRAPERDGHYLPFADQGPRGGHPAGGHSGRGGWKGKVCHRGYGQAGGDCHRRGDEPR